MSDILSVREDNYTREQLKQIEAEAEEEYKKLSEEDREYIRSHSVLESYEYLCKKDLNNKALN